MFNQGLFLLSILQSFYKEEHVFIQTHNENTVILVISNHVEPASRISFAKNRKIKVFYVTGSWCPLKVTIAASYLYM